MIPRETIPVGGKPYLTRYYLTSKLEGGKRVRRFKKLAAFLHHFHASDGDRDLHNHPWTGKSLILWGGYIETRCEDEGTSSCPNVFTREEHHLYVPFWAWLIVKLVEHDMPVHCINTLSLHDYHRVELLDEERGCWTLFLAGERVKAWGFLDRVTRTFRPHKMKEEDE